MPDGSEVALRLDDRVGRVRVVGDVSERERHEALGVRRVDALLARVDLLLLGLVEQLGEPLEGDLELVELVPSPGQLVEGLFEVLALGALAVDEVVLGQRVVVLVLGEREVAEEQVGAIGELRGG